MPDTMLSHVRAMEVNGESRDDHARRERGYAAAGNRLSDGVISRLGAGFWRRNEDQSDEGQESVDGFKPVQCFRLPLRLFFFT